LWIALAICPPAYALNPFLDISQYTHTSWKVRDGFVKGLVSALAQTPDGYLWIGTDLGLFRFDGVRVVPLEAPPEYVGPPLRGIHMHTAADGTLWIASYPGLASWKDGKLTAYPALASVNILRFADDRQGRLWFAWQNPRPERVCSIERGVVRCSDAGGQLAGLFHDSTGTLWAGFSDGIARWNGGRSPFFPLPQQPNGYATFVEENGELLVSIPGGLARIRDGRLELVHASPDRLRPYAGTTARRDRDGALWVGTLARGLGHVHEGRTDVYGQADGLTGDDVFDIFEDREGNLWVATLSGLDRFSNPQVARLSVE
jgi:ligand-binding sensor domain-containing protein